MLKYGDPWLALTKQPLEFPSPVDSTYWAQAGVIIQQVEPKEYVDSHALMTRGCIPLAKILAAASVIFGPQVSPLDALKAIAYHQDPALAGLSDKVKTDLVKALQVTDPESLRTLNPIKEWQAGA